MRACDEHADANAGFAILSRAVSKGMDNDSHTPKRAVGMQACCPTIERGGASYNDNQLSLMIWERISGSVESRG